MLSAVGDGSLDRFSDLLIMLGVTANALYLGFRADLNPFRILGVLATGAVVATVTIWILARWPPVWILGVAVVGILVLVGTFAPRFGSRFGQLPLRTRYVAVGLLLGPIAVATILGFATS